MPACLLLLLLLQRRFNFAIGDRQHVHVRMQAGCTLALAATPCSLFLFAPPLLPLPPSLLHAPFAELVLFSPHSSCTLFQHLLLPINATRFNEFGTHNKLRSTEQCSTAHRSAAQRGLGSVTALDGRGGRTGLQLDIQKGSQRACKIPSLLSLNYSLVLFRVTRVKM